MSDFYGFRAIAPSQSARHQVLRLHVTTAWQAAPQIQRADPAWLCTHQMKPCTQETPCSFNATHYHLTCPGSYTSCLSSPRHFMSMCCSVCMAVGKASGSSTSSVRSSQPLFIIFRLVSLQHSTKTRKLLVRVTSSTLNLQLRSCDILLSLSVCRVYYSLGT